MCNHGETTAPCHQLRAGRGVFGVWYHTQYSFTNTRLAQFRPPPRGRLSWAFSLLKKGMVGWMDGGMGGRGSTRRREMLAGWLVGWLGTGWVVGCWAFGGRNAPAGS